MIGTQTWAKENSGPCTPENSTGYKNSLNETLFFDDFEDEDDTNITEWTTENLEGWHYWHVIAWNGNPGHCMRFENTDLNQDDWLITKSINCSGAENLRINFSHLFHASKVPPKLYYTSKYNGHASESVWKELSYSFGENENQWYQSEDFIIENPGDEIYFAFHYQAAANEGTYFLLDNFKVQSYIPPAPFVKVGSSEHFEFYTNYADSTEFYIGMIDKLEKQFNKLASIWEKPESSVKIYEKKLKVYYSGLNDISLFDETTPDWKSGFYDAAKLSIYLSPIDNAKKSDFYPDINNLAVSELSQLFLSIYNNQHYSNNAESNFIESFGLYESGFKLSRININNEIDGLGHTPSLADITGLDKLSNKSRRELCVSYVEACILGKATEHIEPYHFEEMWKYHLYYFYQIDESKAIRLAKQTNLINIYCVPSDDNYNDYIANKLEELVSNFSGTYELNIQHPINIIVFPDEKTGMDYTNNDFYPGGIAVGTDNYNMLSLNLTNDELDVLDGFLAHEIFHVIHFHMLPSRDWPNWKFHLEGSADFNARHSLGLDIWRNRFWMLEWTFSEYAEKYNIDLTLEHISSNPNKELDVYYLGDLFYEYIFNNHGGYKKIKEFYNNALDYSVFDATFEEIDKGYINYLKTLMNYIPPEGLTEIPFIDSLNNFKTGWTRPSYTNLDNWQINDGGINGSNCARLYINSDKNIPIISWLISPPLNAKNTKEIVLSFDYQWFGEGSELEVFYTSKFDGDTEKSNWKSIQKVSLTDAWIWKNSGEITLPEPPDTLFLGIRYSSPGEQYQQVYVDNFIVKSNTTGISETAFEDLGFTIYPNPVSSESIVSFRTKTSGKVNLSIYDIQGRKIFTLMDENLPTGNHTVPLGNYIMENGVYFCQLSTANASSTLKFIVNKQ